MTATGAHGGPATAAREGGADAGRAAYAIDGAEPRLVRRPAEPSEAAAALAEAARRGLAVAPQGGRTALALGRPLARYDMALDLTALDRVTAHEPDDLTVTVEAGKRLGALQAELAEHGQHLPVDAPPDGRVTIGGLLASGRPGEWRGWLPAARDLAIGMTVALPDGSLVRSGGRVVKNVSGYDLHRLHAGALGAFGVIVEASFRLTALPEAARTFAAARASVEDAAALALALRGAALPLRALSVLAPETAARAGLPERPHVLAECAGGKDALDRAAAAIGGLAPAAAETPPGVWARLRALAAPEDGALLRLGVPPSAVAETIEAARSLLGADAAAWGRLAAGSVLVAAPAIAAEDALALRARAAARGGFLLIEAGPPALRAEADPFGEGERELVLALRARFDPDGAINPGRHGPEPDEAP